MISGLGCALNVLGASGEVSLALGGMIELSYGCDSGLGRWVRLPAYNSSPVICISLESGAKAHFKSTQAARK
jgi:hypothetical protein